MKPTHIALSDLSVSKLNVRKSGAGDIAELASSIAAIGIIQPLLVRNAPEGFEVIAGQRRLAALNHLASEREIEPVPCMVLEDGDDALALEASLAENILRLPMDDLAQFQAFRALLNQGRTVDDIASHFGITEKLVKQRLAIANLDGRILTLYKAESITAETLRILTMATRSQQKQWLKRYADPKDHAPMGYQLRRWLLGGEQISTKAALFDLAAYKGAIISDLFGEERYFADPTQFWAKQNEAIAEKASEYAERGWQVVVLEPESHFPDYEYRKVGKKKGGRIYVAVLTSGEVEFHEGYLPERELRSVEAKKRAASDTQGAAPKVTSAFTKAAANYADLHKHAAVQDELVRHEGIALRLVTAHMIGRSPLWNLRVEPRRASKPQTKTSVDSSSSRKSFEASRGEAASLLGLDDEEERGDDLVDHSWQGKSAEQVFAILCDKSDHEVLKLMAVAMAEVLASGTPLVDTLGSMMKIDMTKRWQGDDAFLDLVTSKSTLVAMLHEIAPYTAHAYKDSKGKVVRSVVRQFLTGEGREKVTGWVPEPMRFALPSPVEETEASAQAEAA